MSRGVAAWAAGIWLAGIYLTLGLVRPVCEELRSMGALSISVAAGGAVIAMLALLVLRRDGRRAPVVPYLPLVLGLVGFVWISTFWELPEERVHFIEYGMLGVLLSAALPGYVRTALFLGIAAGALDEFIQALLPDRTFDRWDIVANGVSVSAAVMIGQGGRASWGGPVLLLGTGLVLLRVHPASPQVVPAPVTEVAVVGVQPAVQPAVPPPPSTPKPVVINPNWPVGRDQPPSAPFPGVSVLLVTVDALRADAVPPWGTGEVALPAFDRLARESVIAQEGFANSLWTTPGIQSLLTGLLPEVHGVQIRGVELPLAPQFPLEQLQELGYKTLGFAADQTETYANLGFEREFNKEQDLLEQSVAALSQEDPAFVWLHLRDIHAPYDISPERLVELNLPADLPSAPIFDKARTSAIIPRREFPGRHKWLNPAMRSLYLAEVADADQSLGRLYHLLGEADLLSRILVVLTADHGEELFERDAVGHASTTLNSTPSPELVQIPFYFRLPGAARGGSHLPGRLEQVDLMPSIFGLMGGALTPAKAGVPLDGSDRSMEILGRAHVPVPPQGPTIVSSTPCGWQCPEGRRRERVHALVVGELWEQCRPPQSPCSEKLANSLEKQAVRAKLLRAE